EGLQQERMAGPARGADSRVTKYEQRLQEVFNFTRPEIAVLCVLLLRAPRTQRAPAPFRGAGRCAVGVAEADAARTAAGEGAAPSAGDKGIAVCASAGGGRGGGGSSCSGGHCSCRRLTGCNTHCSSGAGSSGASERAGRSERSAGEVSEAV